MPNERRPRTNLNNIATFSAIEAAAVAAILLSVVTSHVRFAKNSVFIPITRVTRHLADKFARSAYYLLLDAANSKLAQNFLPASSSWKKKIETACTISRRLLGDVFAGTAALAYYLIASAYVIAIASLTIPIFNILHAIRFVCVLCACTVSAFSKVLHDSATENPTEGVPQATLSNLLFMSPVIITVFSFNCTLLFVPTILYRAFSSTCMTLLTPVYMISSLFGLDNRFNIYNYKSGVGYVHCYIQDKQQEVLSSESQSLIVPIEGAHLVKEATEQTSTCRFPYGKDIYPYSSITSSTVVKHTQQPSEVLGR